MTRITLLSAVAALFTTPLLAQDAEQSLRSVLVDPFAEQVAPARQPAGEDNVQTPAYDSPRQAIYRRAALKAAQRRQRMAVNKWFGYSPSRPPSSTVPVMGSPIPRPVVITTMRYPGIMYLPRVSY